MGHVQSLTNIGVRLVTPPPAYPPDGKMGFLSMCGKNMIVSGRWNMVVGRRSFYLTPS